MSYINNLDFKSVPKSEDVERNILNLKLAEIRLFSLGTKDRKFFFLHSCAQATTMKPENNINSDSYLGNNVSLFTALNNLRE